MTLDEARQILLEHKKLKQSPRGGVRWYASDEDAAHARRRYKKAHSIVWFHENGYPPTKNTPYRQAKSSARHRTVHTAVTPEIMAFYKHVAEADAVVCFWCRRQVEKGNRSVDHFMPLKLGGKHEAKNLVAACRRCNSHKRDLLPDVFIHDVLPSLK